MKRGFTLIELLVVIAIIGVLTGIILVSLSGSKARARDAQRVSDLAQLQLALELFYDRCNQYPFGLSTSSGGLGCPSGITLGSYISIIPTPPAGAGQNSYDYGPDVVNGKPVSYYLHAKLEYPNAAVAKGQNSPPPCSNSSTSVDYCVAPN